MYSAEESSNLENNNLIALGQDLSLYVFLPEGVDYLVTNRHNMIDEALEELLKSSRNQEDKIITKLFGDLVKGKCTLLKDGLALVTYYRNEEDKPEALTNAALKVSFDKIFQKLTGFFPVLNRVFPILTISTVAQLLDEHLDFEETYAVYEKTIEELGQKNAVLQLRMREVQAEMKTTELLLKLLSLPQTLYNTAQDYLLNIDRPQEEGEKIAFIEKSLDCKPLPPLQSHIQLILPTTHTTQHPFGRETESVQGNWGFDFNIYTNQNGINAGLSSHFTYKDTNINGSASLNALGLQLTIGIASSNPLTALATAATCAAIYGIIKLAETKPLPFLNNEPECKALAKSIRSLRRHTLSGKEREKLITLIRECDKPACLKEEGREILHAMEYAVKNKRHPRLKDWYKKHNFNHTIKQYQNDYLKQEKQVFSLFEGGNITNARMEFTKLLTTFPRQEAAKNINKLLYDPTSLIQKTRGILSTQGPQSASHFFEEAFKELENKAIYQLQFANDLYKSGFFAECKKNAETALIYFGGVDQKQHKETAHQLCILAEIDSIWKEEALTYVQSHLKELSLEKRRQMVDAINLYFENQKTKILENKGEEVLLKTIEATQRNFSFAEYKNDPENIKLFKILFSLSQSLDLLEPLLDHEWSLLQNLSAITTEQLEKFYLIRDTIFKLGLEKQTQEAIPLLDKLLSINNLPEMEASILHLYLGQLFAKNASFDRSKILLHYEQSVALNAKNQSAVILLAQEYQLRMAYGKAEALIEVALQSWSDSPDLLYEKALIRHKKARMHLFCTSLLSKGLHYVGSYGKQSSLKNRMLFAGELGLLGFSAYFQREINNSAQKIFSLTSDNKKEIPDNSNLHYLQTTITLLKLGLGQFASNYQNHQEKTGFLDDIQKINFCLDAISLGTSLYLDGQAIYLNDNYTSIGLLSIASHLASFSNRWGFYEWRKNGEAPTSFFGILGENTAAVLDHRMTQALIFIYQNKELITAIGLSLATQFPELAAQLYEFGELAVEYGSEAISIIVNSGPLGIAAACGVAAFAGYQYYYHCQYQNMFNNAKVKLTQGILEKEAEKSFALFVDAQKETETILSSWDNDAGALHLLDQIKSYQILKNADNDKSIVISLCDKYITANPKDVDFHKIRLTLFIKFAMQKEIEAEERISWSKKGQEEVVQLLSLPIESGDRFDFVHKHIILIALEGKFYDAHEQLAKLMQNLPLEACPLKEVFQETASNILTCIEQSTQECISSNQKQLTEFKNDLIQEEGFFVMLNQDLSNLAQFSQSLRKDFVIEALSNKFLLTHFIPDHHLLTYIQGQQILVMIENYSIKLHEEAFALDALFNKNKLLLSEVMKEFKEEFKKVLDKKRQTDYLILEEMDSRVGPQGKRNIEAALIQQTQELQQEIDKLLAVYEETNTANESFDYPQFEASVNTHLLQFKESVNERVSQTSVCLWIQSLLEVSITFVSLLRQNLNLRFAPSPIPRQPLPEWSDASINTLPKLGKSSFFHTAKKEPSTLLAPKPKSSSLFFARQSKEDTDVKLFNHRPSQSSLFNNK